MGKLGQTGTHGFCASACVKERERETFLRIIRDVSTALEMTDAR
jgi:hypothetical protein